MQLTKPFSNDKWLIWIAVTGFIFYLAFTVYVVLNDKPLDYYMYLISAYALGHGKNIYALQAGAYEQIARTLGIVTNTTPYGYLTFPALLIYPMSFLPLKVGATIWVGLSGFASLLSGFILCLFTAEKWKKRIILLSTVTFVPVLTTMNAGQINLFVLLATTFALYYMHQGKNLAGGAVLSISIWLKPFAIALVPLLIWRRRWNALGGFFLGSLAINVLSLFVFGFASTIAQFTRVLQMVTPSGLYIALTVQNLNGLLGRATTGIPEQTGYLIYMLAAGLLGGISALAIALKHGRRPFEIESALLIAATHLIVPLTWYHHLVMLILVLAFVIIYWNNRKSGPAAILLLSFFVLTNIHGVFWKQLSNLHPVLSDFPVITTLYLWGLLLKIYFSDKPAVQYGNSSPPLQPALPGDDL